MSMFTLQTLGLILLFGLLGLLIGWLIRSFFCKPGSGDGTRLSGSANGGTAAKSGTADTSVKTAVDTDQSRGAAGVDASAEAGGISKTAGAAAAGIGAVAATAAAVAASAKDEAAETAADLTESAGDAVSDAVSGAVDSASGAVSGAVDSASDAVSGAISGAVDSATGAVENVVGSASDSVSAAVDGAKEAASNAVGSAAGAVSGAVDAASGAVESAKGAASDAIEQTTGAASAMADSASETVSGAVDAAGGTVSGAVDTAKDVASDAVSSAKGMAADVVDSTTDAVSASASAASEAAGSATDTLSGAASSVTSDVSGHVDSAIDATSSAADSAAEGVSGTAAAGLAGATAVAAAAYSAAGSDDESCENDSASTAQGLVNQQEGVRQLREEAETMLKEDFASTGAAYGANHVIIGAGPAGIVAAETIRKLDGSANVTVIGDEPEAPYSRMAIPYFLEENIQAEGTHLRKSANHYDDSGIEVLSGRVKSVDTNNKTVETANGLQLLYDKLLIATGSHPLTPPIPGLDNPKVGNCWDLADSRKIIENVKPGSTVVQIGAGFIGCIILESLVKRGANLTVVEMDNRMVPRMLDDQCGGMLKRWCESKGVTVLTETQVQSIEDNGDRITVNLSKGDPIDADYVISATGVASNTDFLDGSGIKLDEGVLVNHHLETNIPGIYAAGDVAQGIDFTTGGYSVHAIQPTAADHGTISAKNMVRGNTTRHKGSLQMNILSTLDLISTSYGAWEGVEGGEHSELVDQDNYKYIRLQFKDDQLVGANTLGITQNIGALRGLIQNKTKLGIWKERLMDNPLHFMDAYVALTGNHA